MVVGELLEVGQIALSIHERRDLTDARLDRGAVQVLLRLLDEEFPAPVEHALHQFWVFGVDQLEQLDREVVGGDEQGLGEFGGVVAVGGPAGLPPLAPGRDQTGGSKCAEVLAHGAGGDLQRVGEFVGSCLPPAFQHLQHPALRGRRRAVDSGGRGGHVARVTPKSEVVRVSQG